MAAANPPLLYARWHGFHTNHCLQHSLEESRQRRASLSTTQIIAIALNHIQFVQPPGFVIYDRHMDRHHQYFLVFTADQFEQFENQNGIRGRMWFDYKKDEAALEDEMTDKLGPRIKGINEKMKIKHYAVTGALRARHRYFIDAESFESITGDPLPEPIIMILQYEMHPRINKAARNAILETQDDPPVPRGMTMARPIIRKGARPPVVPGQGPQHGEVLQDEGPQHQEHHQAAFNLEEILVTLVGKSDATAERILKLEEQMCCLSNKALFSKRDYEKALKTNDMVKNGICSSKGNSASLINMLEEHVAGLSKLFLSLKMVNANDEEHTEGYTSCTDDYESAPSRHRTSKSRMKNKCISSEVEMDKDNSALENNLKFINKSMKFFKKHLAVAKTGENIEVVTAVEEQMASFCSSALFLKNLFGEDMVEKLLHLKKRDEKAMRTENMREEQAHSLKGKNRVINVVEKKLEQHGVDLPKSFLSLKMASADDEEPTGGYSSEYEPGSSSDTCSISVKGRMSMVDRRKASTSRLKNKDKDAMDRESMELHKKLQTINEGVEFLKELLQVGITSKIVREKAAVGDEGAERQGVEPTQGREFSLMDPTQGPVVSASLMVG